MMLRWARTARPTCAVVLGMALPLAWPAFVGISCTNGATAVCRNPTVDRKTLLVDNVLATNNEAPLVALIDKKWVPITTPPQAAAWALLAEVSVLGFTYCLLKRRRAELRAFCSWLAGAIERCDGTTEARIQR
jgi:hypothetical protein